MRKKYDLVIKGNIVLPERMLEDAVLAVKSGKITNIFTGNEVQDILNEYQKNGESAQFLDVSGMLVLPGVIDAHVHSFSSLEEGFINATRSAVAGGVTTIVEMPYDADGMINSEEAVTKKIERIPRESLTDVALLATLKNSKNALEDINILANQGICGFKLSMFNTDPERFPRIDDGLLYEFFREIAKTGLPVGVHAENDEIVRYYLRQYQGCGENNPVAHCKSRPKVAESAAVATALELARNSGVKLHIYHGSYPEIFDLIDSYRGQGTHVTAETCPHYLLLNSSDMENIGAKVKINPPLREKTDSEGLWTLLNNGGTDIVTSDHAPWTLERKSNSDIFKNASGAPGVETLLPLLFSEGVAAGKISVFQLVRLLCENPARIFGMGSRKGIVKTGYDADFAIINPGETYILDEKKLHSSAGWSPYNGFTIRGKIKYTVLRGKIVFNDGIVAEIPTGEFVASK